MVNKIISAYLLFFFVYSCSSLISLPSPVLFSPQCYNCLFFHFHHAILFSFPWVTSAKTSSSKILAAILLFSCSNFISFNGKGRRILIFFWQFLWKNFYFLWLELASECEMWILRVVTKKKNVNFESSYQKIIIQHSNWNRFVLKLATYYANNYYSN